MARRLRPLAATCIAAALALAGCGGGDQGVDENADLIVYSGRSERLVGDLVERFEQESGLDVSVRYGGSTELAAVLREEGSRSPADVAWMQDAGSLDVLGQGDMLTQLPSEMIADVPAEYRAQDGTWTGTSARARVIAFDTRQLDVGQVPRSVYDLTQPAWRGKVGWAPTNASFQSFVTAMRATAGDDRTRQWIQGMVDNDVQRYENNIAIRDAIARGEVQLGLINHYYVAEAKAEDPNYPVGVFSPPGDIGAMVNVAGAGVIASSDAKPAAQRFMQFLLGREAQQYFVDDLKEYAILPDYPTPTGVTPISEIRRPDDVDLSKLGDVQGTVEMLQDAGVL